MSASYGAWTNSMRTSGALRHASTASFTRARCRGVQPASDEWGSTQSRNGRLPAQRYDCAPADTGGAAGSDLVAERSAESRARARLTKTNVGAGWPDPVPDVGTGIPAVVQPTTNSEAA